MKLRGSFFAGVAFTLVILAMGATALAASGQISFNTVNVAWNGETGIPTGSTITAPNGQQVPSSILYTDEAGGTTNYLSIRAISDLLNVEISYDADTNTIYLGDQPASQTDSAQRWKREVDGRDVLYYCEEEGHSYSAPPAFRPMWEKDGWGISKISHDTRNYMSSWDYQGAEGRVSFSCAYPSTAGIGRQMDSTAAIENCQNVIVQGSAADYYQDGDNLLLVWENEDDILFFLSGKDISEKQLFEIAESVEPCSENAADYSIQWLPNGYALLDHYEIADTVLEHWVRDGVALSWMYSPSQLQLPDWDSSPVEIRGAEGRYWEAKEPLQYDDTETGSDAIQMISVPGQTHVNILAWQDPDTGIFFRLQSTLDKDTMLRIAASIQ